MLLWGECFPGWQVVKRAVTRRSKNRRLKNRRREKDKGPPNFNPIYDDHCWFDTPPSTPRAHPVSAMARAMGSFKQRSLRLARGHPAPSPNNSPFRTYTASTEGEVDACRDIDDTACSTFCTPPKPKQPISSDIRAKRSPQQYQRSVDIENVNPNRLGVVLSPCKSGLSVIGEGDEGKSLETSSAAGGIDDCITVDSSSRALSGKQPFNDNIPESVDTSESITLDSCSSEESVDEPEGLPHDNPFEGSKLGFDRGQNVQGNGEEHWEADIVPASPWESSSVILRI